MTKRGPLNAPDRSALTASIPEVAVRVITDWKIEKTDWDSRPDDNLADEIGSSPIPSGWEARRTKDNDVYFINIENQQLTACLWRATIPNNDTSAKLVPLPTGWTVSDVNGRVVYKNAKAETVETLPETDENLISQTVIKSKEYCQLGEFFPQYLIGKYTTKPPAEKGSDFDGTKSHTQKRGRYRGASFNPPL